MDPNERIPEPGALWQRIAVGYCEWVNGEWPDDDDISEARAVAKHIATYVECLQRVSGECPMGCGRTLFLGNGGHITCSLIGCPRPGAVDELLHREREMEARVAEAKRSAAQERDRLREALEVLPPYLKAANAGDTGAIPLALDIIKATLSEVPYSEATTGDQS